MLPSIFMSSPRPRPSFKQKQTNSKKVIRRPFVMRFQLCFVEMATDSLVSGCCFSSPRYALLCALQDCVGIPYQVLRCLIVS